MVKRVIKPLNAFFAGFSFLKSTLTGKSSVSNMPVAVGVELTNYCNLRCPECSSGSGIMTRQRGFMNIDLFGKIIKELKPYIYNINLYFQGEAMMHPQFFSFPEKATGLKVTVSTNGHFLSEENAEKLVSAGIYKLIVSLDGMDQETYAIYRQGGDFEKVILGIRNVSEAIRRSGSSLKFEIQFLVNRYNESQIPAVSLFAREINAKLRMKSMQIINNDNIDKWLPENERYRRYRGGKGNYRIKNPLNNRCLRLWLNPVITWDGKVVPCCFDKNADHIMGDLNESSFRDIWFGEKYKTFRVSVLTDRKAIDICRNCTSGLYGVKC